MPSFFVANANLNDNHSHPREKIVKKKLDKSKRGNAVRGGGGYPRKELLGDDYERVQNEVNKILK